MPGGSSEGSGGRGRSFSDPADYFGPSDRDAAADATGATGGKAGLWGMLSSFMFSPADRTTDFEKATSTSPQASLPKNFSHMSFNSECFSDGDYYDAGDSSSDAADETPGTPPPPMMRRNNNSFGSFQSVSL
jgi:hypothetical protein